MQENKPLLSICIPTYNRADILLKTLKDIVRCRGFDSEVEIIISDNCSTDDTQEKIQGFATSFSNIKYFRNETNVRDENFWLVLQRATGEYIKLQNDYLSFTENGLEIIKENLKKNHGKNIFFTDGNIFTHKNIQTVECEDLNDYVKYVSTFVTYIPIFGLWKKDLELIKDPLRTKELQLLQVDWTYQLLSQKKGSVLVNDKVFQISHDLGPRGGYNWFNVHIKNYYEIMLPFVESGAISKSIYKRDVDNALKHFKTQMKFSYTYSPAEYKFEKKGTFKILSKYCRSSYRFYLFYLTLPFLYLCFPVNYVKYSNGKAHKLYRRIYNLMNRHLFEPVKKHVFHK